jgi:alpha-galactosidase
MQADRGRASVTGVWHDEREQSWLLEMRSTGYAFGLADTGAAVRHWYWGPALPRAAVAAARVTPGRWEQHFSLSREAPDEYVPWGGLRYDEPTLRAEFADGTRAVEWRYSGQRVSRAGEACTLEVDLADPAYGLQVTLYYRIWDGFDVVERWAAIRNDGDRQPVTIRQALSANWWMPAGRRWRLRYLHGGWAAETQLTDATVGPGKLVLESRRGTTGHHLNPWFTLDPDGASTETSGEVWSAALAWSGSWKIVCETTPAGRVHVCGGWNDFDWAHELAPGEDLVLPVFAGLYSGGGFGAASREWHAWQRAHVLGRGERTALAWPTWPAPAAPAASASPAASAAPTAPTAPTAPDAPAAAAGQPELRPVLYNSWEATGFAVSEDGQARLAELAAQIGAECFVVDDGWFAGRNNDRAGLGDWTPDPVKFPRGLTPLIERVKALGMRFGLWVEPEMVNPDSDLYRAHPDWVYHFANRARTQRRNQLVLNLARPDVADWVFRTLDGLLSANDIGFVKWDMNRPFAEPGWPEQAGRNPERIWTEHVRNLYAILDGLRAAHPGTDFESCSGGGGRVDLGILGRVQQVWTSDNTDAWDRVAIQEGFTQVYPAQVMAAWVTDSPNFLTGRRLPLSFRFHVAMAGALGIGGDLLRWDAAELAEAARLVAVYKEIRPVIQRGSLYRVASARTDPVGASEYLSADGSEVVVLCWWGPGQLGGRLFRLRLAGLDPDARYTDADTGAEHLGAALMNVGLDQPGGADFGSALIRMRRSSTR